MADLHGTAGRHQLAGCGNADRPHQRGVLDLQLGSQINEGIVDRVHSPVGNGFQSGDGGLQHSLGDLGVGLGLLVSEELNVIIGQCVEEIDLFGNVR